MTHVLNGGLIMKIKVKEIEQVYDQAAEMAEKFVEGHAREILRKHGNLDEFIMAMGGWFFTLKKPAGGLHYVSEEDRVYLWKSPLAKFIALWDERLRITGRPMRFTAYGPKQTDW